MVELRELTLEDGQDVFEMVKEMGPGENGFQNSLFSEDFEEFQEKLLKNYQTARSINLLDWMVPQTLYWLYVDGQPVGYGKFRHYLTDHLREHGGHIGYAIRPTARKKVYATILLKEILVKAREKELESVLLTCYEGNVASRKVIENNNGVLAEVKNGSCYYWIEVR